MITSNKANHCQTIKCQIDAANNFSSQHQLFSAVRRNQPVSIDTINEITQIHDETKNGDSDWNCSLMGTLVDVYET